MKFTNGTPFAAQTFEQYDQEGKIFTVAAAKATFVIKLADGRAILELAQEQDPFLWEDEYEKTDLGLALVKQADFVPFKPATDVTLRASGWFYGNETSRCDVELHIDQYVKKLTLHAAPYWQRSEHGWQLNYGERVKSIPIRWDRAFGGKYLTTSPSKIDDVDIYNPIGTGYIDFNNPPALSSSLNHLPAPQILYADERLEWGKIPQKRAGFAPVAPSWEGRLQFAGQYDEKWKNTRHPLLPRDFDERFWNVAPPDQQFSPWLKGGERIKLVNLHPMAQLLSFQIPRQALLCRVHYALGDPSFRQLVLDGVHIDLERDFHPFITLCWRANFPFDLGIKRVHLFNGISTDDALANLSQEAED